MVESTAKPLDLGLGRVAGLAHDVKLADQVFGTLLATALRVSNSPFSQLALLGEFDLRFVDLVALLRNGLIALGHAGL